MKKTVIILCTLTILGLLLNIFSSCDPCHIEGPITIKLDSINAELEIIKEIQQKDSFNSKTANYFTNPYIPENIGLRYDSIGITVIVKDKVALLPDEPKKGMIFCASYACDPVTIFDKLSNVTIISSADYNYNYPKGTDLLDLMSIHKLYQVEARSFASLTQHGPIDLFYTFNIPPSENRSHDISIKYTLTDGRTVETTVKNVIIRK